MSKFGVILGILFIILGTQIYIGVQLNQLQQGVITDSKEYVSEIQPLPDNLKEVLPL